MIAVEMQRTMKAANHEHAGLWSKMIKSCKVSAFAFQLISKFSTANHVAKFAIFETPFFH